MRTGLGVLAVLAIASLASHAAGGSVPEAVDGADLAPRATADADLGASAARPRAADGGAATSEPPEAPGVPASPAVARLGALPVHLPTPEPVIVGFHEAATVGTYPLTPAGRLAEDRNTTRTDLPADEPDGVPYLVLSSRGRAAGPTSAIDVVMRPDDLVLAGVTGTVVDVRSYLLYGTHTDVRIEIVPAARPDLRLVAIHVGDPLVAVGDEVVGGVTPIADQARRFPFGSQIDRETEPDRFGHVHLEVQDRRAVRPGDEVDG